MKKPILLTILALLIGGSAWAQCDDCTSVEGKPADRCFTISGISDRCAQFRNGEKTFIYEDRSRKPKKQIMELPLPENWDLFTRGYVARMISQHKKLKLTPYDALFIYAAVEAWQEEQAIRNWNRNIVNRGLTVTETGLGYKEIELGSGPRPHSGQRVTVHYTGYLADGKKFDSSLDRGMTFAFDLGKRQVISGWEEGIMLMPIGSRFLFRLPPELGYGASGIGGVIPPNAVLYFDVRLLSAE